MAFKAFFVKKLSKGIVQCTACNHYCVLGNNGFGKCLVRQNQSGVLESLAFGKPAAMHVDPIEKKPLFHFHPGSKCLSFGTLGCNFKCGFCQNSELSQEFKEKDVEQFKQVLPKQIVQAALESNCEGIAYTYNEPSVFADFALETMTLACKKGLYNVWVSNGFFSKEVRKAILPFLDAINIDLKGSKEFYQKVCGGINREKVLENIEWLFKNKVHVELTYLIIPCLNDGKKDFQETAEFVLGLSDRIPLHFSAFHPEFKMLDIPPTPKSSVLEACRIAEKAGLKFVHSGNI